MLQGGSEDNGEIVQTGYATFGSDIEPKPPENEAEVLSTLQQLKTLQNKIVSSSDPVLTPDNSVSCQVTVILLLTGARTAGRSQLVCRAAGWSLCHWAGSSGSPTHAAQTRSCRLGRTGMSLDKVRLQDGTILNLPDLSLKPPSQQFSKLLFPTFAHKFLSLTLRYEHRLMWSEIGMLREWP